LKEQNKQRLELIHRRFAPQVALVEPTGETFEEAFVRVRDAVLRPVMDEVARELTALGHAPTISCDPVPHEGRVAEHAIALGLGIRGAPPSRKNHVVFGVMRWAPGGKAAPEPEVLAFHEKDTTPFDLFRYPHPDAITADAVEQLLVDSIESLFAQNR
jgi:hypothetical protein